MEDVARVDEVGVQPIAALDALDGRAINLADAVKCLAMGDRVEVCRGNG